MIIYVDLDHNRLCVKYRYVNTCDSTQKEIKCSNNIPPNNQEGETLMDNIKPIFPVSDELLELVDLLNDASDKNEDKVIPQTMTVLNKVYAQGVIEGYEKAMQKQAQATKK